MLQTGAHGLGQCRSRRRPFSRRAGVDAHRPLRGAEPPCDEATNPEGNPRHAYRGRARCHGAPFDEFDALTSACLSSLEGLATGSVPDCTRRNSLFVRCSGATEKVLIQRNAPASIATHLDELVNAINTAAHLSGMEAAALLD